MIRSCLLFLMVWPFLIEAQDTTAMRTPMDHFNEAARQYVKQDKISALRTIDKGLRQYPGDARLRKLAEELLKEDQQQQQQQQQAEQQKQDQQQEQQQQQGGEQQDQQQRDGKEDAGHQHQRQEGDEGTPKPKPGEIAPQDAKRILDALDRQEQQVQSKLRQRQQPAPKVPVDKDW
ncbi:MAG: hypothetical protein IPN62_02280 [Flavobacteriales bacterium]|jgi:hypothetical protein|nr:hypothetical protein [Flavobacteriales bacterium]MBP7449271.1 hypothetical protein [Flavobacteriales bacterium]HOZ40825.1 hypothetical protein [Flavobacteriales bacterium]